MTSSIWPRLVLTTVLMLKLTFLAFWFHVDRLPPWGDQFKYHRMSTQYADLLSSPSRTTPIRMLEVSGPHPPFLPLSGAIIRTIFGDGYFAERKVLLLFVAGALIYGYHLGKITVGIWPSLLGLILICGSAEFSVSEHLYMLEMPLILGVTASTYHLLRSNFFINTFHSIAFGLWLGIGISTKDVFPLYLSGILTFILISAITNRKNILAHPFWNRRIANIVFSFGLGLGIGLPWLIIHYKEIVAFNQYAIKIIDAWTWTESVLGNMLFYPERLYNVGLGPVLALILVLGLILGFFYRPIGFSINIVAFTIPLIGLAFLPKDITGRYIFSVLCFLAFAAAAGICRTKFSVRVTLTAILIYVSVATHSFVAWGVKFLPNEIKFVGSSYWLLPKRFDLPQRDVRYLHSLKNYLSQAKWNNPPGISLSLVAIPQILYSEALETFFLDGGLAAKVNRLPTYFPETHKAHIHLNGWDQLSYERVILKSGFMIPQGKTAVIQDVHQYSRDLSNIFFSLSDSVLNHPYERREWVIPDGSILILLEKVRELTVDEIIQQTRSLAWIDPDDLATYSQSVSMLERADSKIMNTKRIVLSKIIEGIQEYNRSNFESAKNIFEKAIAADPDEPLAHWWLIKAMRSEGSVDSATLLKSKMQATYWAPLLFEIAADLINIGQKIEGCQILEEAIKGDRLAVPSLEQFTMLMNSSKECEPLLRIISLRDQYRSQGHVFITKKLAQIYLDMGLPHFAFEEFCEAARSNIRDTTTSGLLDSVLAQMPQGERGAFFKKRKQLEEEVTSLTETGEWVSH